MIKKALFYSEMHNLHTKQHFLYFISNRVTEKTDFYTAHFGPGWMFSGESPAEQALYNLEDQIKPP